jgi:hypothetical protein
MRDVPRILEGGGAGRLASSPSLSPSSCLVASRYWYSEPVSAERSHSHSQSRPLIWPPSSSPSVRDPVKVRPYWFIPWGSLNAVRKYVSSPTTSTGLYLGRIGIYKVDYKLKNKEIRVRRRIIRVSDV